MSEALPRIEAGVIGTPLLCPHYLQHASSLTAKEFPDKDYWHALVLLRKLKDSDSGAKVHAVLLMLALEHAYPHKKWGAFVSGCLDHAVCDGETYKVLVARLKEEAILAKLNKEKKP